jgi:RNA polymerase sigma-70 factor (ECF subfamily)
MQTCNKSQKFPFPMIDGIPFQIKHDDAMHDNTAHDDADLIKRAQKGKVEAFGVLYERYAATIFRFVYSQTLNRWDAEDMTADVFLKAWQALPQYQDQGFTFSPFLFRIARNTLIDSRRKRKITKEISEFEMRNIPEPLSSEPDSILSKETRHHELVSILNQLREDYRTVIILRFFIDLSPEEISHVMERSVGAVRILQHRALRALRKLIPPESIDQ